MACDSNAFKYDSEDSIDTWTLTPEDHALVAGKSRVNRLGFAVLLLFFRANGRFPEASEIHPSIVARVAEQLGTNNGPILDQAWHSRTGKRHRAEIRVLFGFREPTEYLRCMLSVTHEDGTAGEAWTYVYNWPVTGLPQIASGKFLEQ